MNIFYMIVLYSQNVDDLGFPVFHQFKANSKIGVKKGGSTLSIHVQAASVVTKVMVPAPNLGRYQMRRGTWPIEHTIHHRIKQPAIIDEVVSYFVIINKAASSPSTSLVPPWNTAMKNTTQIDGICQRN